MASFKQDPIYEICKRDTRYDCAAYFFLIEAFDATLTRLCAANPLHSPHMNGKELLEGIRDYALSTFGPMAYTVLTEWGIRATADFGEMVFNLIEAGRLGKADSDTREDFADVYDFEETFLKPFAPPSPSAPQ